MTTTHNTRNTITKALTFVLLFPLTVITSATLTALSPTYVIQAEHRFQARVRHHRTHGTIFARHKPNISRLFKAEHHRVGEGQGGILRVINSQP